MATRKYDIGRSRSGNFKNPRRLVTQPDEDFEQQEEAAAAAGFPSWAAWATDTLKKAAKRKLAKGQP